MEIKLRTLEEKDVTGMVEWMSDPDINTLLHFSPSSVSIENSIKFIHNSWKESKNIHKAIVDEYDEYLGTVSLKNIDYENECAELAMAIRKKVMGKGVSIKAMDDIFQIGFNELHLNRIYWYVRTDNLRAVKYYDKHHFRKEGLFLQYYKIDGQYKDVEWYAMLASEYDNWKSGEGNRQ